MGTLVCRIDDVFDISGRGCVVTPGVPKGSNLSLKVGDLLLLKRPDGSELRTILRGLEMGGSPEFPAVPILLGADVKKDQVPIGTEVWTVSAG